jgi:bifunctional DNA-binding transcriptional regulator/antitoxin component of YhaV-PrlF toxin-antitoxin module
MKATAQISSNNGHTVLPAAVRRFWGVGKGARIEFESRANGEVVVRPLPTLDALFGSLGARPGLGRPSADESAQGWNARAERVLKKGRA